MIAIVNRFGNLRRMKAAFNHGIIIIIIADSIGLPYKVKGRLKLG